MKIAMQFQQRFWENSDSIGQRIFTDTPLRRCIIFQLISLALEESCCLSHRVVMHESLEVYLKKNRMKISKESCKNIWNNSNDFWENGISKYWNEINGSKLVIH